MKKILVVIITVVMFLYQGNFTQVFSNNTDPIVIGVLSVSAVSAGGAFLYIKKIKPSLKK